MRVSIRVRFVKCEILVLFALIRCLDTVAHHEHNQRTNHNMNKVWASTHTHRDTHLHTKKRRKNAIRSYKYEPFRYNMLRDLGYFPFSLPILYIFFCFAIYWWHYQVEIKKFKDDTMVIQVVISLFDTLQKFFSGGV